MQPQLSTASDQDRTEQRKRSRKSSAVVLIRCSFCGYSYAPFDEGNRCPKCGHHIRIGLTLHLWRLLLAFYKSVTVSLQKSGRRRHSEPVHQIPDARHHHRKRRKHRRSLVSRLSRIVQKSVTVHKPPVKERVEDAMPTAASSMSHSVRSRRRKSRRSREMSSTIQKRIYRLFSIVLLCWLLLIILLYSI